MATVLEKDWDDGVLGGDDTLNVATSTTQSQSPSTSIRFNLTAQNGRWIANSIGADPSVVVLQAYIYFASLPNTDTDILGMFGTTNGDAAIMWDTSESKFAIGNSNGVSVAAGGPAVSTGTWYKLDLRVDTSANPWVVEGKVDDTDLTSDTMGWGVNTVLDYRLGPWFHATTGDIFMDTLKVSHTSGDYPIAGPPDGGTFRVVSTSTFS